MKKEDWKGTAELIGIVAIVASLVFVGLELKQNRDVALATARDSTVEGFRELNFARMNADWYWEIAGKLNAALGDTEPHILGIPVSTPTKWRLALAKLNPEELGRFSSYHLQERNEAARLYELNKLGLSPAGLDGIPLILIRAPLWDALFGTSDNGEFSRLVLQELEKYSD